MFNRVTAMYIGNHYAFYSKAESVNELKKMVYEKCYSHITDDEMFKKGTRLVDWENIFKALKSD